MTNRTLAPTVAIAFDQFAQGQFYLDHSQIDGLDGLYDGNAWPFTGTYDDVTDDVDGAVYVVLGTDDLAGSIQASTCDFVLKRPGTPGYWNPHNPTSPPNSVSPGFREMRPVKVTVNDGSTDYGLFWGFIRNAHYSAEDYSCAVHCEDLLLWMSRQFPVITNPGATTTGAVIGLILDAIGWSDATLRSLATGDSITGFTEADGSRDAVSLIADLIAAERGTVYVDPTNGVFTYKSRDYPQTYVPTVTLTNQLSDLGADLDLDRIYTRITVTRTGGVAQTSTNATAEEFYGRADLPSIGTPYLPDDATAALLAADILWEKAQSVPPVRALVENEDAATTHTQLTLRPLQAVNVVESLAGTDGTYTVEQLRYMLDAQGFYLALDILASLRPPGVLNAGAFAIDVSGLDGNDVIRY